MTGYSRVYNKQSGDVILAEEFVTEFGSIDAAFDETTGHSHSGATGEGAPISVIGNAALTTKVEIDSANNEVEFHANGAEQVKITDGAILPITDNDIDLGAVGAEFKNLYIDGTANIDNLVADTLSLGSITLTTDLAVVDGGTGASTAAGARTNLGLGSLATASTINNDNWSGTDLSVVNGGTGASDAATARSNLGLVIGTNVQAYDADLSTIAGLAKTDGNFIVGNGTAWTVESGATARTSLGLGSIATQNSNSVSITGGSVSGLTSLAVDNVTIDGATISSSTGAISFSNENLSTTGDLSAYSFSTSSVNGTVRVGASGSPQHNGTQLELWDGTNNGTIDSEFENLVIRATFDAGMTILAGDSWKSSLGFADSTAYAATIVYDHNTDVMEINAGASGVLQLSTDGVGTTSTTNLGAGTTDPSYRMHIVDNAQGALLLGPTNLVIEDYSSTESSAVGMTIVTNNTRTQSIKMHDDEVNSTFLLTHSPGVGGYMSQDSNTVFVWNSNGFVALGTGAGNTYIKTQFREGTVGNVGTTTGTDITGYSVDQIVSVDAMVKDDSDQWHSPGASTANTDFRVYVSNNGGTARVNMVLGASATAIDNNAYRVFVFVKDA